MENTEIMYSQQKYDMYLQFIRQCVCTASPDDSPLTETCT